MFLRPTDSALSDNNVPAHQYKVKERYDVTIAQSHQAFYPMIWIEMDFVFKKLGLEF